MADEKLPPEFINALGTEYFVPLSLRYEHRRLTPVVLSSSVPTAMTGDSPGVT